MRLQPMILCRHVTRAFAQAQPAATSALPTWTKTCNTGPTQDTLWAKAAAELSGIAVSAGAVLQPCSLSATARFWAPHTWRPWVVRAGLQAVKQGPSAAAAASLARDDGQHSWPHGQRARAITVGGARRSPLL